MSVNRSSSRNPRRTAPVTRNALKTYHPGGVSTNLSPKGLTSPTGIKDYSTNQLRKPQTALGTTSATKNNQLVEKRVAKKAPGTNGLGRLVSGTHPPSIGIPTPKNLAAGIATQGKYSNKTQLKNQIGFGDQQIKQISFGNQQMFKSPPPVLQNNRSQLLTPREGNKDSWSSVIDTQSQASEIFRKPSKSPKDSTSNFQSFGPNSGAARFTHQPQIVTNQANFGTPSLGRKVRGATPSKHLTRTQTTAKGLGIPDKAPFFSSIGKTTKNLGLATSPLNSPHQANIFKTNLGQRPSALNRLNGDSRRVARNTVGVPRSQSNRKRFLSPQNHQINRPTIKVNNVITNSHIPQTHNLFSPKAGQRVHNNGFSSPQSMLGASKLMNRPTAGTASTRATTGTRPSHLKDYGDIRRPKLDFGQTQTAVLPQTGIRELPGRIQGSRQPIPPQRSLSTNRPAIRQTHHQAPVTGINRHPQVQPGSMRNLSYLTPNRPTNLDIPAPQYVGTRQPQPQTRPIQHLSPSILPGALNTPSKISPPKIAVKDAYQMGVPFTPSDFETMPKGGNFVKNSYPKELEAPRRNRLKDHHFEINCRPSRFEYREDNSPTVNSFLRKRFSPGAGRAPITKVAPKSDETQYFALPGAFYDSYKPKQVDERGHHCKVYNPDYRRSNLAGAIEESKAYATPYRGSRNNRISRKQEPPSFNDTSRIINTDPTANFGKQKAYPDAIYGSKIKQDKETGEIIDRTNEDQVAEKKKDDVVEDLLKELDEGALELSEDERKDDDVDLK